MMTDFDIRKIFNIFPIRGRSQHDSPNEAFPGIREAGGIEGENRKMNSFRAEEDHGVVY